MEEQFENMSIQMLFRCIVKETSKLLQKKYEEFDLTKSQIDVLRVLGNAEEPMCQRDIQDALHVTNPTVTGLLNRMEKKGFIVRVTDKEDRRVHYIELTDKAKEFNKMTKDYFTELDKQIRHGLTDKQMDQFQHTLAIILKNLKGVSD